MTNREIISRVRSTLKEHQIDSHLFNRHIYSVLKTKAFYLIKQDYERRRSLSMLTNLFQTACVEMKEVSAIECCIEFPVDCKIYRSKNKLPGFIESVSGIIYKSVTSVDRSEDFTIVTPFQYNIKRNIRHNKGKYVFIDNGYLYSPDVEYPVLRITALFDGTVESCDDSSAGENTGCSALDQSFPCPEYLLDPAVRMAIEELSTYKQIQYDGVPDKNTP